MKKRYFFRDNEKYIEGAKTILPFRYKSSRCCNFVVHYRNIVTILSHLYRRAVAHAHADAHHGAVTRIRVCSFFMRFGHLKTSKLTFEPFAPRSKFNYDSSGYSAAHTHAPLDFANRVKTDSAYEYLIVSNRNLPYAFYERFALDPSQRVDKKFPISLKAVYLRFRYEMFRMCV